jgi:CheY-like chemotaxis protein
MAAIGAIPHDALTSFTVLGELGLGGSIAAVAGVLPAAISANGRGHGLICPYACGCEAAWASPEIEIVAAARIFLDFEQADDSATRKFSGTGLGLAISKRIIARMGGRIGVTSKETAGSTFTISVSLPAAPDSPQESFTPPHLGDDSVMIVATAEIEASLLARRLRRWGARTCAVTQKNIAFALLPERAWDTLVVDYPIASAFVAGGQLSKLGVQKRIVLIRPTERHELPALKSAGFTGYLVKPVCTASLAARFGAEDAFEHSTTELAVEAAEALPAAGNKGLSILVAEDNDINALLARALLTRLGHRPTIASNGAAAFESWLAARAAGAPYDLVLMDVRTPEMDGLEAACVSH